MLHDLVIRLRRSVLAEGAHDEHRHMVARRIRGVVKQAVQRGRCRHGDVALLGKLARDRRRDRLAHLDAAPGQMPAADVAVPHQEDAPLAIENDGPYADRQPAREPPEEMKKAAQDRF